MLEVANYTRNEQSVKEVEEMYDSMVKVASQGSEQAGRIVHQARNMVFFAQIDRLNAGDHIDPKDRVGGNIRRENFEEGFTINEKAFFYTGMLREELLQMLGRTETNLPNEVAPIVSTVMGGLKSPFRFNS